MQKLYRTLLRVSRATNLPANSHFRSLIAYRLSSGCWKVEKSKKKSTPLPLKGNSSAVLYVLCLAFHMQRSREHLTWLGACRNIARLAVYFNGRQQRQQFMPGGEVIFPPTFRSYVLCHLNAVYKFDFRVWFDGVCRSNGPAVCGWMVGSWRGFRVCEMESPEMAAHVWRQMSATIYSLTPTKWNCKLEPGDKASA